jgi:flagellar biosynthesis chaperone FliJ
LAGVGVFLQSYSQQMEREMITVTDQTYKVFNGIQRSLDVLQDMYAQKKAMCINHDDTVKEKEEVYRLSLSKVRAMKEMYDEAVKESETAKNNLADATAEKYKVCVIADGLHHSARPLQDFIQDMTDYLNRQESN